MLELYIDDSQFREQNPPPPTPTPTPKLIEL